MAWTTELQTGQKLDYRDLVWPATPRPNGRQIEWRNGDDNRNGASSDDDGEYDGLSRYRHRSPTTRGRRLFVKPGETIVQA
jgi:hypothetical protein